MFVNTPIEIAPESVTLRAADAAECAKAGFAGAEAVAASIRMSTFSYAACWNGRAPFAYWGYGSHSILGSVCYAWMLTTPEADTVPRAAFALASGRVMRHLLDRYTAVAVVVDLDHSLARNWLKALGFRDYATSGEFIQMIKERA